MAGAPAALALVGGGNLGGVEDILEAVLECVEQLLLLHAVGDGIKAGLAAHRRKTDEFIGVIAHEVGHHVLDGVHSGHFEVSLIGLAEAQVVLDDLGAASQRGTAGHADIRGLDVAVVQLEGFNIAAFSHI